MVDEVVSFNARYSVQGFVTMGGSTQFPMGQMVAGTTSNGQTGFVLLNEPIADIDTHNRADGVRTAWIDDMRRSGTLSAWVLQTTEVSSSMQTCLGKFGFGASGGLASTPETEFCFQGTPTGEPSSIIGERDGKLYLSLNHQGGSKAVIFDERQGQVDYAMQVWPYGNCALSDQHFTCVGVDQAQRLRVTSKELSTSNRAEEAILSDSPSNSYAAQVACWGGSECMAQILSDYRTVEGAQQVTSMRFSGLQSGIVWEGFFASSPGLTDIACVSNASEMQCYLHGDRGYPLSAISVGRSVGRITSAAESTWSAQLDSTDQGAFVGTVNGFASVVSGDPNGCGFQDKHFDSTTIQGRLLPSGGDPTTTQIVTQRTPTGNIGEIKDRRVFDPCDPPTDTNAPTGQATSGSTGDTATPTPGGTGGTVSPTPGSTGGTETPTPGSTVTPTPFDTLHTQLETAGFTGPAVPTLPRTYPPTEAPSDGNGSPPQASHTGLKITGLVLVYAMLQWFFQYSRFSWVSQGEKQAIGEGSWARYNYLLENSVLSRDFLSVAIETHAGIQQAREAFEAKLFLSELAADADYALTRDNNVTITRRVADKKNRSLGALAVRGEEQAIIDDEVRAVVTNQQMEDGMVAQANESMLGNLALGRLPIVRLGRGMGLVHQFTELLRFPQLLAASGARWGGKEIKASDREAIVADAYAQICFILANTLKDEDIDTSTRQSLLNLALELEAMAVGFKGLADGDFSTVRQANALIRRVDSDDCEDALARLGLFVPLQQPRLHEQRQLRRLFRLVEKRVRQTRNQYAAYVNRSKLPGRYIGKYVPPKEERAFLDARGKHVGDIEAEHGYENEMVLDVDDNTDDGSSEPLSVALRVQGNGDDDAQPRPVDDQLSGVLEGFLRDNPVAPGDKSALAAIAAAKRRISGNADELMDREVLLSAYEGLTEDLSTGVTIWEQAGVLPLLKAGIAAFDGGKYGEAIRLFSTAGKIVHAVEDQLSKENSDVDKEMKLWMEKNPGQQPKESMAQRVRICAMLLVTYKKLRIEIHSLVGLVRIKHAQEGRALDDDERALSEREQELQDLGFDDGERTTILRGEEGCVLTTEALDRAHQALQDLKDVKSYEEIGTAANRAQECMQRAVQVFRDNKGHIQAGSRCVATRIHQIAATNSSAASAINENVMKGFEEFRTGCVRDKEARCWEPGALRNIQQLLGDTTINAALPVDDENNNVTAQAFESLEELFLDASASGRADEFLESMQRDRNRARAAIVGGKGGGLLARVVGSPPAARNADPQAEGMNAPLLQQQLAQDVQQRPPAQDARQGRHWCCCFPSSRQRELVVTDEAEADADADYSDSEEKQQEPEVGNNLT